MFMMSRKRKKLIVTVVAVFISFIFLLSVVAGNLSSNVYTYDNSKSLPISNSASTTPATSDAAPAAGAAQTTPGTAAPQK